MNKLTKYTSFSSMKWLDDELKLSGIGRHVDEDSYYGILQEIKMSQENGSITDEVYSKLKAWAWGGTGIPEYGYYMANIHYDLCRNDEDLETIENRIILFLKESDFYTLRNSKWFAFNFWLEFTYFLRNRNNEIKMGLETSYIEQNGSDMEKEIYKLYENIISRDYYATESIHIKFYSQLKSRFYTLKISPNSIAYEENHMGINYRIFKKNSKYFKEDFSSEIGDSFISGIYNIIRLIKPNNYVNPKYYDNFLEINMFDEHGVSFYSYVMDNIEKVVNEIGKILDKKLRRIKDISFLDIFKTDC